MNLLRATEILSSLLAHFTEVGSRRLGGVIGSAGRLSSHLHVSNESLVDVESSGLRDPSLRSG